MLRESLARGGIVQLIDALQVPQPRLRTALVAAELVSLAMVRYVLRLTPPVFRLVNLASALVIVVFAAQSVLSAGVRG